MRMKNEGRRKKTSENGGDYGNGKADKKAKEYRNVTSNIDMADKSKSRDTFSDTISRRGENEEGEKGKGEEREGG
jgi:hypothetical protein